MKNYTALLIASLSSVSIAGQSDLIAGSWSCKLDSPYLDDATISFKLNNDSTYEKITNIHGTEMTHLGTYKVNGDALELERKFHIKRGKKEPSSSSFSRNIQKLDENNLTLAWSDSKSICTK